MNAALLQILVSKGILSRNQANSLGAANGAARTQQLLLLLKQKGLLSDSDMAALKAGLPECPSDHMLADIKYSDNVVTAQVGQAAGQTKPKEPPAPPPVIPPIAPVVVLPIDPPGKYGFIKATMAYDSLNSISRLAPLAWAPGSSGPTNPRN